MAKKLQSSLAVEGELPEDGLAAYGDDGDDLMMALARKIVSGDEEEDAETVEAVFAQARDAEAASEEFLVDDGWKAGGGRAGGRRGQRERPPRRRHRADGRAGPGHRPRVTPTATDTQPSRSTVNGHYDEAPEPQQTLFSWAEFMAEEPVKPKGHSRKAQPATLSMFEWALTVEQEREKEPVGARR